MSKRQSKITRRLKLLSDSISGPFGRLIRDDGNLILHGTGDTDYTCGKCDTILMSDMRRDQILANSALFCNNCKTFNDANSYVTYPDIPIMLKDIPKTVENLVAFNTSFFATNTTIPFSRERDALSNLLYSYWVAEHFHVPGVLYQYTSFYGLVGILNNHSIWVTDVAYMNDTSEMKYGIDMVNNYITEKKNSVSEECKVLLDRSFVIESELSADKGYLIACFCSNDDLLSQWRAYGGGGSGYNIGFSSSEMAKTEGIHIRKVIYDLTKQQNYVSTTIDSICELFESAKGNKTLAQLESKIILTAFSDMLSSHLNEFLYTFKHPSFSEEDEWRIVRPYRNNFEDRSKLKFRQYNSVPVPYMEIGLKDINDKFPFMPVVQVTYGPTLHPQLTKKSLLLMMIQNGYSHAEIKGSTTPLR